jgi:hypothetical protein
MATEPACRQGTSAHYYHNSGQIPIYMPMTDSGLLIRTTKGFVIPMLLKQGTCVLAQQRNLF